MKARYPVLFFLILASVSIYYYSLPPSPKSIVLNSTIDTDNGFVKYNDVVYLATWGEQTAYSGDIRHIGRAYYDRMPIFTHDVILTTGEFSDPELVRIDPVKNGQTRWRAREKPRGTLTMLHPITENSEILAQLESIHLWDQVDFGGREEEDNFIEGSDSSRFKVIRSHNHVMFLLTGVWRLEE